LLNTWVRRSELVNIKKENINTNYIKIINWKWQKDRIVYITKKFNKEISEYIKLQNVNENLLFCTLKWSKLNENEVNKIIKQIQKWTNIKLNPHLFRHTYASLCIKKWINIYTLQQQMWHTDLKTTSIYLYMNNKENWEEIQKLDI
jgi:site-specific recombinase XerD